MAANYTGGYGSLDRVRLGEGNEKCIAAFGEVCQNDKRRAVLLLSDQRLTFSCLFLLLPQIKAFEMEKYLRPRAAMAQRIADSIRWRSAVSGEADVLSKPRPEVRSALQWMLGSGSGEDSLGSGYDEALDIAASVLLAVYKDEKALETAVDLMFNRNRKGRNIHYLIWAVFQIKKPQALKLIARRIRSENEPDIKLACGLLNITEADADNGQKRYEAYLRWLKENDPYLYFSGESYQMTSEPVFYHIDLERKYFRRSTPYYEKQPLAAADETERRGLAAFKALSQNEKMRLAEYSYREYKANPAGWRKWLQQPVSKQLAAANQMQEEPHDYDTRVFV